MKELIATKDATFFTNTAEMKGNCIQFPSFMSEQIWAPGSKDVCISKKSRSFLVFAGQKHISLLGTATIDKIFNCVR